VRQEEPLPPSWARTWCGHHVRVSAGGASARGLHTSTSPAADPTGLRAHPAHQDPLQDITGLSGEDVTGQVLNLQLTLNNESEPQTAGAGGVAGGAGGCYTNCVHNTPELAIGL
jgi:hypothetical protein